MNIYYDPILGLQYTYLGDLFIINIECLPIFDKQQWLKYIREVGVMLVEPNKECSLEIVGQITNYMI